MYRVVFSCTPHKRVLMVKADHGVYSLERSMVVYGAYKRQLHEDSRYDFNGPKKSMVDWGCNFIMYQFNGGSNLSLRFYGLQMDSWPIEKKLAKSNCKCQPQIDVINDFDNDGGYNSETYRNSLVHGRQDFYEYVYWSIVAKGMHGLSPGSVFIVNAEVDSMGGVIDGGVFVDNKTSPCRAAIERAQAELRQEYDVREERRRELEFLEKGGNPLDFKFGSATSISFQSTSVTDPHNEQDAKGNLALAASPHGDSVDSSAKPLSREPTTADNLLLFDGENDKLHGDKNAICPRGGDIAPSEQLSRLDRSQNVKETEDSAIFRLGVKSQAYARRNRSRSGCDGAHFYSMNLVPSSHNNLYSILPSSLHNSGDTKGSLSETRTDKDQKDQTVPSICNSKTTSPDANLGAKIVQSDNQMDMELGDEQANEARIDTTRVGLAIGAEIRESESNQHPQKVVEQPPNNLSFMETGSVGEGEHGASVGPDCVPYAATEKRGNSVTAHLLKGMISNRDESDVKNEAQNCCFGTVDAVFGAKGLDSDLSSNQINHSVNENDVSNHCSISRNVNSTENENVKEQSSLFEAGPLILDANVVEASESRLADMQTTASDVLMLVTRKLCDSDVEVKINEEICNIRSDFQNEAKSIMEIEDMKLNKLVDDSNSEQMNVGPEAGRPSSLASLNCVSLEATCPVKDSATAVELRNASENDVQLVDNKHEDAILEEARKIEDRRRRVSELCLIHPQGKGRKSHWDFVLEEMVWLANDFMQERVWKTTAAAQISKWVACNGRLMFNEKNLLQKQRNVAHTLAKAILQFWHLVDVLQDRDNQSNTLDEYNSALTVLEKANGVEPGGRRIEVPMCQQGTVKDMEEDKSKKNVQLDIQRYAIRFLRYSKSSDCSVQAEAPKTPDRVSDTGILQLSQEDQCSEETVCYSVPSGAMEVYRKAVESHWAQYEGIGNNMNQEEFETSFLNSIADEEDEGETGIYYSPRDFEGSKSSKFIQKTKKGLQKSHAARSYDMGSGFPYGHHPESKLGSQQSLLTGKRPPSSLNVVSVPTKRVRTAARQRNVSPFGAGATAGVQLPNKTDASSGDTSSFHEDQSSVHGGGQPKKMLEVESTGDFVKQFPFDSTDVSTKPKKKKAKHLGYRNTFNSTDSVGFPGSGKGSSAYEQRWHLDSIGQHEKRDLSRKRLENEQLESNGSTGLYGQHSAKKPKLLKQLPDASLETATPVTCSIPSPVASQMSNMSNPNKLMKMIANRDRGKKSKALKIAAGQSGLRSPWSLYEDQALIVLVHDMGPNWELVSDAINSTLQFKCIFRKPKECKERYKIVMDRNVVDGADSAEDSGSSQPYPSSLPGIPKGSARQLFQRLQGPMEEDTLKTHFEKIILIGQQLHSFRIKNENHEVKQISAVHSSHAQACPNNLNGSLLTPLDLCDAAMSSPDILSPGYQASQTSGLAVANHQGSVPSVLPASGANTMLQGSTGMVIGNNLPLPSATLNGPARDMHRYGVRRPASLPIDEQRMQQYNLMLSNRNMQQPTASVHGPLSTGTDRGVCMLPGANGMGMMCGMSRGMAMSRPGFPGIGSSAMLNVVSSSGNVLPSNGVGLPNPVNMHNSAISSQGNAMMRPREALQMLRPCQNSEDQRNMIIQELQMRVTQGNGPGVIPYNGLSTSFANQTAPPVQTFPVQQQQMPQQPHVVSNSHHPHLQGSNHSPQQQAYVIRMAKERHQLQQRILQQQQQQFAAPNTSMPHSQPQLQHPLSPVQTNSQTQQQSSAQSVAPPTPNSQHPLTPPSPMNPATFQAQQKQHGPHGIGQNSQIGGGLPNQMLKQRQRQQFQQQSRHHPQQRQQSQQQVKLMKGLGRGSLMMHQNIPLDASHVNGLSPAAGIQVSEKGQQPVMHLMQGQCLFPGSGRNPVPPGKQLVAQGFQPANQAQQQKFSRLPQQPMKQQLQIPPHLDNNHPGQVQIPPNHALLASQQPVPSPSLTMASQQQQQLQRQTSQSQQAVQRVLQQNHQMQSPADQAEATSQLMNNLFQMGASTTMPQSTVLNNTVPAVGSVPTPPSQWKMDPLYDTSTMSPTTHLASVGTPQQSNSAGTEPKPSTSQRVVPQGQFSGSISVNGHNICGLRQQQPQLHQQDQHQLSQQQQQGQAGQGGSVHAQPSISGPG